MVNSNELVYLHRNDFFKPNNIPVQTTLGVSAVTTKFPRFKLTISRAAPVIVRIASRDSCARLASFLELVIAS